VESRAGLPLYGPRPTLFDGATPEERLDGLEEM